jgi:hypothetical protein
MLLNKKQKKLVKKINDPNFTIEFLEKYYKEKPGNIERCFSYSLAQVNIYKANAFMAAVNGLID